MRKNIFSESPDKRCTSSAQIRGLCPSGCSPLGQPVFRQITFHTGAETKLMERSLG